MTVPNIRKIPKSISIPILLALLAGCGGVPPAAPAATVDTQALRTEVAQTVIANPTIQSALNPPPDTPTTPPTQAPVVIDPTETAVPTLAPPTETAAPPPATVTFTPIVPTQGQVVRPTVAKSDEALLMYAQPAAYTHFQPREPFDAVWTFKNVGMKTWTNEYFLTFDGGSDFTSNGGIAMVGGKVHPGTNTQLVIDMQAPSSPGTYTARFSFYNDNRFVFGVFYIVIIVD
jgi:hypothetical protein